MQNKAYNPVHARNIPLELAQIQRERGYAMTKSDFKALGYTDAQLCDSNIAKAAELFAHMSERIAA